MNGPAKVSVYFGGAAHEIWTNSGLSVSYTGRVEVLALREGGAFRADAPFPARAGDVKADYNEAARSAELAASLNSGKAPPLTRAYFRAAAEAAEAFSGLGDIQALPGRLYAVVNCSNLVEVMDVYTAEHIGSISIPNCRYIVFEGDRAYVSSYAGPVQIDPEARPGKVVEIDTRTLEITREVTVGYQPEEMVITGGRLYVANSGGYRFPNYDRTVSVIDLDTFEVVNTIDVAINLHRMELDRYGRIYVSSRGDYYGTGSDIYVIDAASERVIGSLGIAASEMCIDDDRLYIISTEWSYTSQSNEVSYAVYDTAEQRIVSRNFITDGTDREIVLPYGVAVNPETKELYVCDATNYVTPGYLYCFSPEGEFRWRVRTGDIPAHIAFSPEPFY